MYCPSCGKETPENSSFCLHCGKPIIAPAAAPGGPVQDRTTSISETKQTAVPGDEITAARMKSYTGSAVLVFFLYWLFYLPGLIVNYMYLQEAKRMEKVAGKSLPGTGCLSVMLWVNVIAIVLGVLIAIITVIEMS